MKTRVYGDPTARFSLIQPVDGSDLAFLEEEIAVIGENARLPFQLLAVEVPAWNRDLSPWDADPVFGKAGFGHGAADFLRQILSLCDDGGKTYVLGGYSLAGLFALWAATRTDRFAGIAAASPSAWFPGFSDYLRENPVKSRAVYLSLGDREEKTKNPVMATVGDRIRLIRDILRDQGAQCVLEWNEGNHFKDVPRRTGLAFAHFLRRV